MQISKFFQSTAAFLITYVLFMLPTYLLPYLGSNSTLVNGTAMAFGLSMPPTWWAHCWSLFMLMAIAQGRGEAIGKQYLPLFPLIAMAFDLAPVLSMIPFVPTIFHLFAIGLGVTGIKPREEEQKISMHPLLLAVIATVIAIVGSVTFISQMKQVEAQKQAQQTMMKPLEDRLEMRRQALMAAPLPPPVAPLTVAPEARHQASANQTAPVKPAAPKTVSRPSEPVAPAQPTVRHIDIN